MLNVTTATIIASMLFGSTMMAHAADPSGPAASAAQQWFTSDRSLSCFNRQEQEAACGVVNSPNIKMYYGDADGGTSDKDALAIVNYLNDPSGNSGSIAGAYFRRDGSEYRFVKTVPGVKGQGVAPGTKVRFGGGKATMTMLTMRPGDSTCCLTGKTPITVSLR